MALGDPFGRFKNEGEVFFSHDVEHEELDRYEEALAYFKLEETASLEEIEKKYKRYLIRYPQEKYKQEYVKIQHSWQILNNPYRNLMYRNLLKCRMILEKGGE